MIPTGQTPNIHMEIDAGKPLSPDMRDKLASMSDLEKQMHGFGLTVANFIYHIPDAPSVLNTFTLQRFDLAPDFPVLHDFIAFWQREIEGPLRRVEFAHRGRDVAPTDYRNVLGIFDIRGS